MTLAIAGAIGALAVAASGRLVLAICIGLIAAFAVSSRRWFLRQMDARLSDRDADAVRRLHSGGMLSNAVQLAAVVACIPYIAVAPPGSATMFNRQVDEVRISVEPGRNPTMASV